MSVESHRIRIAMVAGTLTPGGAEKQLSYHVRCLADAGVDVLLVSLDGEGYYGPRLTSRVADLVCIDESWGRLGRLSRLVAAVRRFAPDYVQASHTYANLYAVAAARASGAVSIGALRANLRTSSASNGRLTRWHLAAPDTVIANSERSAEDLSRQYRRGRYVHVLGNVIDVGALDREMRPRDELRRMAGAAADDIVVLGVGTMTDDKRFDRFLRVLEHASAVVPNLRGVLVGDGPWKGRLEAQIAQSPVLQRHLTLAGRTPEAVTLMPGADIFFLSSDNEGFPNTLLEAMTGGLPVVTTPAGDAGLVVERSSGGFVRGFDDESGMAAAITELARSASARRELGSNGRRYVEEVFDLKQLWPRMQQAYAEIARRANRPALAARVEALPSTAAMPRRMPGRMSATVA